MEVKERSVYQESNIVGSVGSVVCEEYAADVGGSSGSQPTVPESGKEFIRFVGSRHGPVC